MFQMHHMRPKVTRGEFQFGYKINLFCGAKKTRIPEIGIEIVREGIVITKSTRTF